MSSNLRSFRVALVCAASMFMGGLAQAETAYVTDMLQLELYANEAMTGRPIRKLRSGDSFEILQRKGRYANVRMPDGQTGWVKSLYIVDKEPARTRLNKLDALNTELAARVDMLTAELADKQTRIDDLVGDETSTVGQLAAAQTELEVLRADRDDLQSTLASYGSSVPLSWLLVGSLFSLVLGAVGGWYFIDRASRAKHGGYRVY